MSPTTIPEISELTELVQDAIEASDFVVDNGLTVILDDGLQEKARTRQLKTKGAVVVVCPLLGATLRDQSGTEHILDVGVLVKMMVNTERNTDDENSDAADVDIYEGVKAIVNACCRKARHPGGEFLKLAKDAFTLSEFHADTGLWVYDIQFTKECAL